MVAGGDLGEHPPRAGRISAGLADETDSRRAATSRPTGASTRNASGAGGAIGDIGTHAFNLADFVTGLDARRAVGRPQRLRARDGALDDNVQILLRFANGARGLLWASQVAPGNENGAACCASTATKGGLDWGQEDPNYLLVRPRRADADHHPRRRRLRPAAARVTRVPPGHPEGYLEGFANIYSEVAAAIKAARSGKKPPKGVHFPTIDDGVKGLAFIEAAVKSSKANGKWVKP